MHLLCFIQGHQPSDDSIWNRGYSFSKCRRCSCDMLRSDGDWFTVPRGHRVAWKPGQHHHSRPAGYPRTLPSLPREVRRGLPGKWLGAWYRHFLIGSGFAPAQTLSVADEGEAREAQMASHPVPSLAALIAVRWPLFLWIRH